MGQDTRSVVMGPAIVSALLDHSLRITKAGRADIWQVFGLCDQTYQGLSIDWDAANPLRNGDWGQIIPPKKARAVARKSKNPKHPAVKRKAEEDWGK